jgi:hypothetical protein
MDEKSIKKEPETPLWKVDIPLNILVFSFIVSPVPLLLWGKDLMEIFQNDEILLVAVPYLLLGLYLSQFIPFTLLSLHRRKLYGETATGLKEMYFRKRTKCEICGRHPVSKGYHLKHVHNLTQFKKSDYFKNCGCGICVQRMGL